MPGGARAVVAQSVFRLQKPGPVWNAETSTVFGSTPTPGKVTSRSPAPAVWMVLTAPAELKFTGGGGGGCGRPGGRVLVEGSDSSARSDPPSTPRTRWG